MRTTLALLPCLALAACSRAEAPATEILWDKWGVPHVFANDEEGAFFAFGWAQMQAHGDLILRLYGQARGRGAEYWGAEFLETDRWVRIVGGDTYYAAIEFSSPIQARVLTAYGSATQPGSPHRGDQLELFARKEMRPVWRTRSEIEANLEKKEALSRR